MTLEEEIIELTNKWMKYISIDHHKDRDCHWYITKTYSYGQEPYWEASHHGYLLDNWTSPKCGTEELAKTILRDKLKREIDGAIMHLKDTTEYPDAIEWMGTNVKEINKLIKDLS